jgi:hypothetical protein
MESIVVAEAKSSKDAVKTIFLCFLKFKKLKLHMLDISQLKLRVHR